MADAELDTLIAGLIERKLPSFSLMGQRQVERGILAGATPDSQIPRLARRTALYIQRILLGEEAADLPVEFPTGRRITINMATARAIGVSPPWRS